MFPFPFCNYVLCLKAERMELRSPKIMAWLMTSMTQNQVINRAHSFFLCNLLCWCLAIFYKVGIDEELVALLVSCSLLYMFHSYFSVQLYFRTTLLDCCHEHRLALARQEKNHVIISINKSSFVWVFSSFFGGENLREKIFSLTLSFIGKKSLAKHART